MHPSDQDWPRCACGCGEPVPARKANDYARGFVKGEPCKFVAGHSNRPRIKLPRNGVFGCSKCRQEKPVTEFHADSNRPSGLSPWCKDCQAAKARKHYRENRERLLAATAEYHAANPEVQRKARARYTAKPEYAAQARRYASAYRARRRGAFVEHVDPITVFERNAGICGICSLPISGPFDVDHIVPLSKGGEHSYANCQAAHPSCNYSKKDRVQCA